MAARGWHSVHDPDVLPRVMEDWGGAIESGEPFEMVFPLRGADGVFRPFLTRVAPVRENGRVVLSSAPTSIYRRSRDAEAAISRQ